MPTATLEERVSQLERELKDVKCQLNHDQTATVPWWDKIFGSFANSTEYDEAMRLGREYRESLRPLDYENDHH